MKKSFVELLNEGIIEQVEKREAAVVQGGGVEPKGGDWPNLQNCDSSLNQHLSCESNFGSCAPNQYCPPTGTNTACPDVNTWLCGDLNKVIASGE